MWSGWRLPGKRTTPRGKSGMRRVSIRREYCSPGGWGLQRSGGTNRTGRVPVLLEDDAEGCFVLGAAADHQFVAGLEDVQREAPAGEEDHAEGEERNASS